MKKMSVKSKVALWYAFSLISFLILAAALILAAGDQLILKECKSNLVAVTDRALEDVRIISGKLVIDHNIDYYSEGAYIRLYREDGTLLSGLTPENFPEDTDFQPDRIRLIKNGKYRFYLYDRLIDNRKVGKIWVRGTASARLSDIAPSVMKMLTWFAIAIPILFIIALAGGIMLTKQAFMPLQKIVDTAEEIRKGGNLHQRIGMGDPDDKDEIRRTAGVFDEMLDQIEKDFEREKQFTNDASHELRTPVAVMLARAEYALDNPNDQAEVKESLQDIRKQAIIMSNLLTQLLTMARADRNVIQMNMELTDISILAEESAMKFYSAAEHKGIRLTVDAEECSYIEGDPIFLGRMFDNLIDNSIKYGRNDGQTFIQVKAHNQEILVKIEDNGIGMDEKELPRIWERFYRIRKQSGHEDERSLGLGLPIVKWIVESHKGDITVESSPGKGTRYLIRFPEAKVPGTQ